MRLRRLPNLAEKLEAFYGNSILRDPQEYRGRWCEFFDNNNPIYVELGTGKGRFITTLAQMNPNINYIGIEYQEGVIYYAAKKVQALELENLVLLRFDINQILEIFALGEVQRFFINFCDPWPKKRHAFRRLTHCGFLDKYCQILNIGSEIHFKTDNERLFEFSLNELAASPFQLQNITLDLHNSGFAGNVMTEYEQRFANRGMKIYRCEAVLTS